MLAFTYDFGVEAPSTQIRPMVEREQAACTAAGPAACAVTGSSVDAQGGDTSATMTLKVAPDWVPRLKAELADDLKAAGGHFTKTGVTSEDLSVQIVDADAHVKAQTALRDRLQEALQQRPGKVSDFVDLANAVSKAQGDLDAMQSEVALLHQRVATSDVTINYRSSATLASGSTWAPLSSAISGFMGLVAMGLAAMVSIVGIMLPWVIAGGAAAWIIRALRRRRQGGSRQPE
jgi:hypothetical protein